MQRLFSFHIQRFILAVLRNHIFLFSLLRDFSLLHVFFFAV